MKKVISLILALLMVASLSITAFAADITKDNETGSITINGVSTENTYEIYQMLVLESYDVEKLAYSYKATTIWADFFASDAAKAYFTTDASGYVTWTWKPQGEDTRTEEEAIADFAKLALNYAKNSDPVINPNKSTNNIDDFTVGTTDDNKPCYTFSNLPLGYYLVDSTMGALCGLTTTKPDASISAKNGSPTVDKQVLEDSTNQWGDHNTADIGQIVEFRTTINVHAGAENYVLHDTMSNGLSFKHDKSLTVGTDAFRGVWKIEHVVPGTTSTPTRVAESYYTVITDPTDDCTFEIVFTQEFCDHLQTNDKVIVYYNAMLNREAIVAGDGNSNTTQLSFGDEHTTTKDTTTTKTFGFDIIKTDSENKLIDGAKFKIYDANEDGNEVPVVILEAEITENTEDALTDSEGKFLMFDHDSNDTTPEHMVKSVSCYRRARSDEQGVEIIVQNGKVRVVGFDNGTYYLQETEAPDGYNELATRHKFIISDSNLDATFNAGIYSTGSGVQVINKTGAMLPETGAAGTMLFITFGTFVVLGTGMLLVTKKRMSMIVE